MQLLFRVEEIELLEIGFLYFIVPHSIVKVFLRSVFLRFISSCVNLVTDHRLPIIDYWNSQPTLKYPPWGSTILRIPLNMFKFFLFLRHRDVESDILTAGVYEEEWAAIWQILKDKAYSRLLVGVRKLREAAPNRLLAEMYIAGYEAAYHRSQVSASPYTSAIVKASRLHVSILSQTLLSIRNTFS
jgi:hypothetical protein